MRSQIPALIATALLSSSPVALATHDGGTSLSVLRVSPDGGHLLVVECHLQGMFERLYVRTSNSPKPVDTVVAKDMSTDPLCHGRADANAFLDKQTEGALNSLLKKHQLTERPVKGRLSPKKDRYVFVAVGARHIQPRAVVGTSVRKTGRRHRMRRVGPSDTYHHADVLWHPSGRVAYVELTAVTGFDDSVLSWESGVQVLQFPKAPHMALSASAVSAALNAEGYRRDRQSRKSAYGPAIYDGRELYQEAVRWDPKNATALYNLACMQALAGEPKQALETLERLKALDTVSATTKLKGAPKDTDFTSLLKDPTFKRLTSFDAP